MTGVMGEGESGGKAVTVSPTPAAQLRPTPGPEASGAGGTLYLCCLGCVRSLG